MADSGTSQTLISKKPILLFLYFFCVIAAFWMLKPLRTSGVVKAFGPDYYPLIKQGVVFLIPFVLTLYNMMTCFLSRPRMVAFFTGLFLAGNGIFWWLFQGPSSSAVLVAFFYYVDIYVTLMVTLFWTYLNDLYEANEAKKYYGFIGAGGLLGGIAGS
ncbi:MAG: hypothetical protein HYY44_06415, partial [Deltaproteobacteria bacterium]|nr:hypothetical protein [Deltaproteobacteria bacterium]